MSHEFTIAETAAALQGWGDTPACATPKLLLGFDANETFLQPGGLLEDISLSCTGRAEQIPMWLSDQGITLPLQDVSTPSKFPYNPVMAPKAGLPCFQEQTTSPSLEQPCSRLRLEPKLSYFGVPGNSSLTAVPSSLPAPACPPTMTWPLPLSPASSPSQPSRQSFPQISGSPALKQLRKDAKAVAPGAASRPACKLVSNTLQQESREWKTQLADRAGAQDRTAYRALKHKSSRSSWAETFSTTTTGHLSSELI